MKLLVLGKPFKYQVPSYRGTDREMPAYNQQLSDEQSPNREFFWWMNAGGTSHLLDDLARSQALVDVFRKANPPLPLEVVAIGIEKQPPTDEAAFLGYDLSFHYRHSLLETGLVFDNTSKHESSLEVMDSEVQPLLSLVQAHFAPKLNSHVLFSDYADAAFCLHVLQSIQKLRPYLLWHRTLVDFVPVGLWSMYGSVE